MTDKRPETAAEMIAAEGNPGAAQKTHDLAKAHDLATRTEVASDPIIPEPSNSDPPEAASVADEHSEDIAQTNSLLECLLLVSRAHGIQLTREAAMAGLPAIDGVMTPRLFERAAQRGGMTSRVVKSGLARLREDLFPVVLLLKGDQACLLVGWSDDRKIAYCVYPELGNARVEVPWAKLRTTYSGYAIYVRPKFHLDARSPEIPRETKGHWFWGVVIENRRLYRDVLVASIIVNLFALAMPLFVLNVYDRVVPNHAIETLFMFALGIGIVLIAELSLRQLRSFFVDKAAARADIKLSAMIMEKVLNLRMNAYPQSVGSFAATLNSFESVRSFISSATVLAFVDFPFALLFIAVIALIGWQLAIPVVVGASLLLLFVFFAHWRLRRLAEQLQRARTQRNSLLVESLSGVETLKTLGAQGRMQGAWELSATQIAQLNVHNRRWVTAVTSSAGTMQKVVGVIVIIIGVFLLIGGDLSQGGIIAAYLLSNRAMSPISQMAGLGVNYHQAATALRGLNDMMAKDVERPVGRPYLTRPLIEGGVEFHHVSFRYPGQTQPSLDSVSFKINPGEHVAILGKVGSGKSTLAKLILGLYEPESGSILIDGIDQRQIDPADLRRGMGYVSQEVNLFFGHLRDNIVLGAPLADDDAIQRAIKIAGMERWVQSHSQGIDMSVGERGGRISGGQRQSVGIARAVIHEPNILLLDEPTSSMDNASEQVIKKNLQEFLQGRTVVLITHRTSLLSLVDRILVLDDGQLVADGPKQQVLEALKQGRVKKAKA